MRNLRTFGIACLLVASLVAPAAATHGGIHPTFKRDDVWFHCTGETKIYQVDWLLSGSTNGGATSWDRLPPSGSVFDGAGCGGFDVGEISQEFYDVVFEGTFVGNLRDLTVRIHEAVTNQTRRAPMKQLRIYAEIDGEPIFPGGSFENGYTGRTVWVTPTRVNSGATDLFEFSMTNLGYAIDIFDEEGELIDVETGGMALEHGPGSNEHYLRLLIGGDTFIGSDPVTGLHLWVWDTREVESGITFNPPALAAATLEADLPNP